MIFKMHGAFLMDVCPTTLHFKKARAKDKIVNNGEEEEEEGGNHDEDWVNGFLAEEAADNEEVDEVEDFEPGDLLGKVLVLIT